MSWKFNPPPGWPTPAENWEPPPGWVPDPSWPPAPPGWEFWVAGGATPAPSSPAGAPADAPPTIVPPPGQWPSDQPPTIQAPAYQYPPSPYPGGPGGYPPPAAPPRRSSSRALWAIGAALGAVLLVACAGTVVVAVNWDRLTGADRDNGAAGSDDTPAESDPLAWDDCHLNPNTCNGGETAPGGELVWGAPSPATWNVHTNLANNTTLQVISGIAPSTGWFLPDGSWQWNLDLLVTEPALIGADPQSWVYEIRPEARWNDGTDITVDDFILLWQHNADHLGYDRIADIGGGNAGKTVTVTLNDGEADPDWWSRFTNLYPAHVAGAAGFSVDPTDMDDLSTWLADTVPEWSGGPWRVVSGQLATEIVLEPNDQWYGAVSPSLERLRFQIIDDVAARLAALTNGDIDGTGPHTDAGPHSASRTGVMSHVGAGPVWDHIDLNLQRPWLDDVVLRKAIFTAIDVGDIMARTYDPPVHDATPKVNHLLRPDSQYHQDHLSGTGQGSGDPALALAILDGAGYELDGGRLHLDGEPVGPLVIQFSEGHRRRAAIAEMITEQLAAIGIAVETQPGFLLDILEQGTFDLVVYGWGGTPTFANSGNQFWHSDSTSNFGGYSNPRVDALVTSATYAPDLDTAADLLNQAMAIVVDDAYVLPIAYTPQEILASDQLRNIRPNQTADAVFANSHEWGWAPGG